MAYIANRPIRFDRNYYIGEEIPERVIEPKMIPKLISMGRIIKVDLETDNKKAPAETAETAHSDEIGNTDTITQDNAENASDGEETRSDDGMSIQDSQEFICGTCGKPFKSAQALSAHSKFHKK